MRSIPPTLASMLLTCVLAISAFCVVDAAPGIPVVVQFDSTLSLVSSNRKVVITYMGDKLCRTHPRNVLIIGAKEQSTQLRRQSTVTFFCVGSDAKKLISSCTLMRNRRLLKDGIQRHTSPVMKVQRIISCGPAMNFDVE